MAITGPSHTIDTARRGLGTLRALGDPNQLGYLIAYVTNRCNFTCDFCFYHAEIAKGLKPDELTVDEFAQIGRNLGPLAQLSLTGGEPFLRKSFADIAAPLLDHTHARWVTIPTNGWFTERMLASLERLLPAYPSSNFRLVFSIEAIGDAHDRLRNKAGSYAAIEASYVAVSPLRERFGNLVVDANTVFSTDSQDTALDTLRRLDRDFLFDNLSVTYARGHIKNPRLLTSERDKYEATRTYLLNRPRAVEHRLLSNVWRAVDDVSHERFVRTVFDREFVSTCVAGRKLAILGETGEIYACEVLEQSLGNVRDAGYNIGAVLRAEAAAKLRRHIAESRCMCSFECAHAASTVWSAKHYPRVAQLVAGAALAKVTAR